RDRVETGFLEPPGGENQRSADRQRPSRSTKRKREVHEGENGRHEDERHPSHVPPRRRVPERARPRVVAADEDAEHGAEQEAPADRQYGGSAAHQSPSDLKAFQKAVFAACSSSEASTSGTTSASTVGVNYRNSPPAGSSGRDRGNSIRFKNSSAWSPMTTTSFGWTMCSSRVSHSSARASGSAPANLRQFVP